MSALRVLRFAVVLASLALPAAAEPEGGAGLIVKTAEISRGKLVISGTTAKPGTSVSIAGTSYKTKAKANRRFAFRLTWLPPTCRVTLKVGKKSVPAVIANCAPRGAAGKPGLVARGEWSPTVAYSAGAVVGLSGSSHVALKAAGKGVQPGTAAAAGIWTTLAAKGDDGSDGAPAPAETGGRLVQSASLTGLFPNVVANSPFTFLGDEESSFKYNFNKDNTVHVTVSVPARSLNVNGPIYKLLATTCIRNNITGNITKTSGETITDVYGSGATPFLSVVRSGIIKIPEDGEYSVGLCGNSTATIDLGYGTVSVLVFD